MPATMRDVAEKAHVSIKTVSRVVNQQGEVADETRQRVLDAIDALGYRPSKLARALVTQRTDTIGMIIGDITNPYFFEVARAVLDTADGRDYGVFVCNSDGDAAQEIQALNTLADHAVDGIISFSSWENEAYIKGFADDFYHPIVVINRVFEHPGIGMVLTDIRGGARMAVDHLVSRGHTAIAMLAGQAPCLDMLQRVQGFREVVGPRVPVLGQYRDVHGRVSGVVLYRRGVQQVRVNCFGAGASHSLVHADERYLGHLHDQRAADLASQWPNP